MMNNDDSEHVSTPEQDAISDRTVTNTVNAAATTVVKIPWRWAGNECHLSTNPLTTAANDSDYDELAVTATTPT